MSNNKSAPQNPFQDLLSRHKPSSRLKKKVLASARFAVLIDSVLELYPPHITELVIEYVNTEK